MLDVRLNRVKVGSQLRLNRRSGLESVEMTKCRSNSKI